MRKPRIVQEIAFVCSTPDESRAARRRDIDIDRSTDRSQICERWEPGTSRIDIDENKSSTPDENTAEEFFKIEE